MKTWLNSLPAIVISLFIMLLKVKGVQFECLVEMVENHGKEMLVLFVAMGVATMVSSISTLYMSVKYTNKTKEWNAQSRKNMMKSKAMATASHDVRAALSGILCLIQTCYPKTLPGSDLESNLNQMDTCAKDLLELLNDILDVSKMEAGKMQLTISEFNFPKLLKDSVDIFRPIGKSKGVDVNLDTSDGSIFGYPIVRGDRIKIKQVICNLLSNAVKFTPQGRVSLRVSARKPILEETERERDPDCVEFVVEVDDTGKGIPREEWKAVFDSYVQVKEADDEAGGTGLGLSIVQSLVRLMGGEIEIVEKPIGETGTRFRLNIFLTECCDVKVKEKEKVSSPIASLPLAGKKVLIADDSDILLLVAGMIVAKLGAVVEKCRNGKEAVELVGKGLKERRMRGFVEPPYDYVLMDCEMPVMDGREATRAIREEEAGNGLRMPIIALTAHEVEGEEVGRMFEAGMDVCIQKPLQEGKLMEAVRTIERGKV